MPWSSASSSIRSVGTCDGLGLGTGPLLGRSGLVAGGGRVGLELLGPGEGILGLLVGDAGQRGRGLEGVVLAVEHALGHLHRGRGVEDGLDPVGLDKSGEALELGVVLVAVH